MFYIWPVAIVVWPVFHCRGKVSDCDLEDLLTIVDQGNRTVLNVKVYPLRYVLKKENIMLIISDSFMLFSDRLTVQTILLLLTEKDFVSCVTQIDTNLKNYGEIMLHPHQRICSDLYPPSSLNLLFPYTLVIKLFIVLLYTLSNNAFII